MECIICHSWYFNHGINFQKSLCIGCHDLLMLRINLNNISIITVKGVDCHYIMRDGSKSDAIH